MVSLHTNVLDMDVNAAVNQLNFACFVIFFENGQRIHYDPVIPRHSARYSTYCWALLFNPISAITALTLPRK